MSFDFGSFNMWGRLERVAIRPPSAAFASEAKIDEEWRTLNYHSAPRFDVAKTEYAAFEKILAGVGAEAIRLPAGDGLTLEFALCA